MSYGYGSSDHHDHPDLSRAIEEARYDAQRELRDLEERMHQMRAELANYIRTEVEGLSEWIQRERDHSHEQAPATAKDGGR